MKNQLFLIGVLLSFPVAISQAGDTQCKDVQTNTVYPSTTNHFECLYPTGNCVWWAAYKRPDIAAVISGSGWNGGQWIDKLKTLGFAIGLEPRVGAIAEFSDPGHEVYVENIHTNGSFDVSEMDATGLLGSGGVYHATYYPNGDGTYNRNGGSTRWTLKGFIYPKSNNLGSPITKCSQVSATQYVCWRTKGGTDLSCEDATAWGIEDELTHVSQSADRSICSTPCYDRQTSILDFLVRPAYAGTLSSCAKQVISTDYLEDPDTSPYITGGKHEGDLPDLIVHELNLVKEADRDSPHLTQIHIGERSYCNIQVKNIGEAGAWGTWANRCYLSNGNYRDPDPDNLGHESMEDLAAGQSRRVYQIIPAFEYPGTFNITACGDTDGSSDDKAITESDEGNNCHDEYRITVVSDPNLATTAISLEGIVGNPLTNESFSISSTTANLGENFGPDYVYIGYFIDGNYVGRNQIRRENMQGGMSKAESLFVPGGIAMAGVHEVKACADFTGDIAETNETDDCMTLLVNVTDPVNPTPDPEPTQSSPMSQSDDDELFLMLLLD